MKKIEKKFNYITLNVTKLKKINKETILNNVIVPSVIQN